MAMSVLIIGLKVPIDSLWMRRSLIAGPRVGFPHQQGQCGSLPPAPVEVGRFHAFGAPERRWKQRRFLWDHPLAIFTLGGVDNESSGCTVCQQTLDAVARFNLQSCPLNEGSASH